MALSRIHANSITQEKGARGEGTIGMRLNIVAVAKRIVYNRNAENRDGITTGTLVRALFVMIVSVAQLRARSGTHIHLNSFV